MDSTEVYTIMNEVPWICWPDYPARMLPTNFHPVNICCLIMQNSLQIQLWDDYKRLPSLSVLSLDESKNLIKTPDFSGLPELRKLSLRDCESLEEIHPSLGYHQCVSVVNFRGCSKLQTFPRITRMGKLKDLLLSGCSRLGKFPEIEMHMYSLVSLNLKQSGIEIVPSSVGKYCTYLRYLDFRSCNNLKIIEGNFRSLKGLKELHLDNCERLGKLADDFFNEECCLELVSLSFRDSISITNLMSCIGLRCFQQDLVGWKLPHFPRFLTTLSLRFCNLVDGDIPSNICELSNLKRLDLKGNNFVRLRSILSQLNGLKYLDLSHCKSLLELPILPSSISIVEAYCCDSLEIIEDIPKNYKWLWRVSLWRNDKLLGVEKVIQSMLQGNAVENYFMSLRLGTPHSQTTGHTWDSTKFTLLLPKRWYKDFSGFLICVDEPLYGRNRLIINQETHVHYQRDHWEEFDKTPQFDTYKMVGYVSLGSLRHTSWWNSSYTRITFELMRTANIKVGLVPRKSKRGSTERAEDANAEFSDKEVDGNKTFEIKHDSKSYLEIEWFHNSL